MTRPIPINMSETEIAGVDADADRLGVSRSALLRAYVAHSRQHFAERLEDVRQFVPSQSYGRGVPRPRHRAESDQ